MSSKDDEEWVHGLTKSKSAESCIIHYTDASDDLVSLKSIDSWKVLLKAATIRQHESVLKIASSLPEGVMPDIKNHRNCRSIFTMKKFLNSIKEKRKVSLCNSHVTNSAYINGMALKYVQNSRFV